MAGTVTPVLTRLGTNLNSAMLLTISWTADAADGSVPATALSTNIKAQIAGWFIYKIITNPGTTAPTALYDITLVDVDGIDLAKGALANRSATLSETVFETNQIDADGFTFTLTNNSVNSATGVCKIFLNR